MSKSKILLPVFNWSSKTKKILFFIIFLSMTIIALLSIMINSIMISTDNENLNYYGHQHANFYNLNNVNYEGLTNSLKDDDFGVATCLGYVKLSSEKLTYYDKVGFGYIDENVIKHNDIMMIEGSMPDSAGQIAIELRAFNSLGLKPTIGQKIDLNICSYFGSGVQEKNITQYTLVGIIDNYSNQMYGFSYNEVEYPTVVISINDPFTSATQASPFRNISVKFKDSPYKRYFTVRQSLDGSEMSYFNYGTYKNYLHNGFTLKNLSFYKDHYPIAYGLGIFLSVLVITLVLILFIIVSIDAQYKKQQIGLIRAIGGTSKMLGSIMLRDILPPVIASLGLGLVLGIPLSFLGLKLINKFTNLNYNYFIDLRVIGLTALIGLLTVIGSLYIFTKKLCAISPLAAIKLEYKNKYNKTLKQENEVASKFVKTYAKRILLLNKKRVLLTIAALSISVTSCLYLFSLSKQTSINRKYNSINGISISIGGARIANALKLELSYPQHIGISKDQLDEIAAIDGVKSINKRQYRSSTEFLVAVSENMLSEYLNNIKPYYERYGNSRNQELEYQKKRLVKVGLDPNLVFLSSDNTSYAKTVTYNDMVFETLESHVDEGEINLDALKRGEEVVLCVPPYKICFESEHSTSYPREIKILESPNSGFSAVQESNIKPGDKVTLLRLVPKDIEKISYNAEDKLNNCILEQKIVRVGAIVRKGGYIELPNGNYHSINTTPLIYLHNDALMKWNGTELYRQVHITLKKNANDLDIVNKIKTKILTGSYIDIYNDTDMNKARAKNSLLSILTYLIPTLAIATVSLLAIYYTVFTNIENRKKQLGILRAVGMTKSQLLKVLRYEIVFYGLTSTILGSIACIVLCLLNYFIVLYTRSLYSWWYIIPWIYMPLAGGIVTALIYLATKRLINSVVDESITDNIRYIVS